MGIKQTLIELFFGRRREPNCTWRGALPNTNASTQSTPLSGVDSASFYSSRAWKVVRYKALLASNGRCQCCGISSKETGVILHCDHVKPRSKYPWLALTVENVQVLCEKCNIGKGAWDETDWRK